MSFQFISSSYCLSSSSRCCLKSLRAIFLILTTDPLSSITNFLKPYYCLVLPRLVSHTKFGDKFLINNPPNFHIRETWKFDVFIQCITVSVMLGKCLEGSALLLTKMNFEIPSNKIQKPGHIG